MTEERIGGLSWGLPASEVVALLGEPALRGEIVEEDEYLGDNSQQWEYPELGMWIVMRSDVPGGPQKLDYLKISAPSTLTTTKGIGVGASRKAVLATYGALRDPKDPSGDNDEVFIAGSLDGGVAFRFEDNRVADISVGVYIAD